MIFLLLFFDMYECIFASRAIITFWFSFPCLLFVAVYQQLQEYEQKLFGSSDSSNPHLPTFSLAGAPSLNFGFLKPNDPVSVPAFNNLGATSIFARPPLEIPPHEFTFGAGQTQKSISESLANPSGGDISMDSTWVPEVDLLQDQPFHQKLSESDFHEVLYETWL